MITTLVAAHDGGVAATAAAVCLISALTAFRLYSRAHLTAGPGRTTWFILSGVAAGAAIWATHFVGMLAYRPELASGHSPFVTLVSLMVATAFAGAAFTAAGSLSKPLHALAGGALFGFGTTAMHFLAMQGYAITGTIAWDVTLIVAAVAAVLVISIAAFAVAGSGESVGRQAAGAALLTLAAVSLHGLAVAAMTVTPNPRLRLSGFLLHEDAIIVAVSSVAMIVIATGLGAALIDAAASERALERLRRLASGTFEGLAIVSNGKVVDANNQFLNLAEGRTEQVIGQSVREQLLVGLTDNIVDDIRHEAVMQPVSGGDPIPVEVLSRRLSEEKGETVIAVRDLREMRQAEAEIRYLAEHDALTGLLNRNAYQGRLTAAIERASACREKLAVLRIDLDQFHQINDSFGQAGGDEVLRTMGERLAGLINTGSFAARPYGDEFVIVQVGLDQPQSAATLAESILEAVRAPAAASGHECKLTASIGISLFPADGLTAEDLLTDAELALRRAKAAGRDAFRFFERGTDEAMRQRRNFARELREGIPAGQLRVHYQPLARMSDGAICGFETLVRWQHPVRGLLQPDDFVDVAEECGIIGQLTEWVLREACAEAATWEQPMVIAVNLSPVLVHQSDLPTRVHELLLETGLPASRLELEITETALFEDEVKALANLRKLKNLGLRIAIDDFGTGYSSLSTLQSFPFDKIKIDKAFVEKLGEQERSDVIVRTIINLGRNLGISVLAEGVEALRQLDFLRAEGCDQIQGYIIGKPKAVEAYAEETGRRGGGEAAQRVA